MRPAVASDGPAISALMEQSIRAIFPAYYDSQQVESSVTYIGHLHTQLIEDGTYFVHEADGEIVACGGWSRREKLFAGPADADDDDRLLDPAAEPARVRAMFVRGDWTRRGLGRAILEACEDAARAEGFTRLVLGATLAGAPLPRVRVRGRGGVHGDDAGRRVGSVYLDGARHRLTRLAPATPSEVDSHRGTRTCAASSYPPR